MRTTLPAIVLALVAGACSSDAEPAPYGTPPLVDVKVPAVAPPDWELPAPNARILELGGAHVLYLASAAEPVAVRVPIAGGLAGARRLRVQLMADGDFTLEGALAGSSFGPKQGGNTRRQPHSFEFELPQALESDSGVLELRCTSPRVPVLLLRFQALR